MISAFRLIRFRGFEDTDWIEIKPLTLFFGHNSSGKSSLLAGLLMLRQSVLNPDRSTPLVLRSDLGVDLGSYEDLVYGHRFEPKRPLSLSLKIRFDQPYYGWSRPVLDILLRFQVGYDTEQRVTWVMSVGYFSSDETKFLELAREWKPRAKDRRITLWKISSDAFPPSQLPDPNQMTWEHFLPLVAAGSQAHQSVVELCQQVAQQVETDLRAITHIGPLRTEPERVYYFSGESVGDVGRRGENTYKLLAAVQYRGKGGELAQHLNWWLERLGYRLDVQVLGKSPLLQIGVREEDNGANVAYNLKDVGFGISQVLPLLVQCYAGDQHRTILLEQPELHLHPRAQADLGDLLIDALGQGHRFLIETHSEHLLLRLRRRIAETTVHSVPSSEHELKTDDIQVYFVERTDGRSVVNPVQINEVGQIPNPPKGFRRFFSDDYDEMMAIAEAAAARAKEQHDQ